MLTQPVSICSVMATYITMWDRVIKYRDRLPFAHWLVDSLWLDCTRLPSNLVHTEDWHPLSKA